MSANIAITQPQTGGHLTIYPANLTLPLVSAINFNANQTRANNAILVLSTDGAGQIAIQDGSGGTVHAILDVNGYFQ